MFSLDRSVKMAKIKKTDNVGEDADWLELSYIVVKNEEWNSHLGRKFGSFYKVRHILTIWPSSSTPRYLPKRNKNLCPHKDLYPKVYSYFICNSQLKNHGDPLNNLWYEHTTEHHWTVRGANWHMQQHGWSSKTWYMKEAGHKILYVSIYKTF